MFLRAAVALVSVVLVLGLAGCGDDSGDAGAGGSTPTTSAEPSTEPGTETQVTASTVEVVRSGGIIGDETTYTFTAGGTPPDGYTKAQQQRVLAAASAPGLQELGPTRVSKTLCCDRYLYEVTVTWSDGSTRTWATADGVDQPAALAALLQAMG